MPTRDLTDLLMASRDSAIAIAFIGGFLAVGIAETCFPRQRAGTSEQRRWIANIGLVILNLGLIATLLPTASVLSSILSLHPIPVIGPWFAQISLVSIVAGVLVIDVLHYAAHRLFHAVPWLWRLHAVHHSDSEIDVTTSYRHHPGEYVIASFAYTIAHVLLGVSPVAAALYSIINFLWTPFTHANLRLPAWAEHVLAPLLVTPRFHAIHHANNAADGHSNYGMVFSLWDRIAGTARPPRANEAVTFGLIGETRPQARHLLALLALPFMPSTFGGQDLAGDRAVAARGRRGNENGDP